MVESDDFAPCPEAIAFLLQSIFIAVFGCLNVCLCPVGNRMEYYSSIESFAM